MSPFQLPRQYTVITAPRPRREPQLRFRPLTLDAVSTIRPYLEYAKSRTCDFTIGGLLMWADYFSYSYAIHNDTLYIKGVTEDDVSRPAFSLPVGKAPLSESVALLKEYCRANDCMPLVFSAVPEMYVEPLERLGVKEVTPLEDWGDYLYEAEALATLSGKKLGKKRNHVNRFMADNPDYRLEPLTAGMIPGVMEFYRNTHLPLSKPALADVEREQVIHVLENMDCYPFEGAVLSTPANGIVAFALGEVIGDTLYVHIEKMNHEVAGAGETINKLFAEYMRGHHPEVRYINREEDVGDPGLRHAKESYHPAYILAKYNVEMK
ncbi:MAG: phosphatidylglycerol lysyltransferase domain-containing protein [Paenibacillus sp.]|nr:phosphatidylglycerol lysyltransferase domain-containing protein [Paenibacillus sp.]